MEKSKRFQLSIKYALDKLFAGVGLILSSPIFLLVALILKLQGEDVFYKQKRVGHRGEEFEVYKFTTMPKGSEKLGYFTTTNDPRPTKFGRFLRKTKINELPQLINVLKGDMSIIGPRPLIKEQILKALSEEEIREYYQMRPGITGAGSVYYHHEDRLLAGVEDIERYYNEVIIPRKKELESQYARDWSLGKDVEIFYLTLKTLLLDALGVTSDPKEEDGREQPSHPGKPPV